MEHIYSFHIKIYPNNGYTIRLPVLICNKLDNRYEVLLNTFHLKAWINTLQWNHSKFAFTLSYDTSQLKFRNLFFMVNTYRMLILDLWTVTWKHLGSSQYSFWTGMFINSCNFRQRISEYLVLYDVWIVLKVFLHKKTCQ